MRGLVATIYDVRRPLLSVCPGAMLHMERVLRVADARPRIHWSKDRSMHRGDVHAMCKTEMHTRHSATHAAHPASVSEICSVHHCEHALPRLGKDMSHNTPLCKLHSQASSRSCTARGVSSAAARLQSRLRTSLAHVRAQTCLPKRSLNASALGCAGGVQRLPVCCKARDATESCVRYLPKPPASS